jgi:hypothetical protein
MDPLGLTTAAWEALALSWGLPRYRGRQVFDALHRSGRLDYASMQELPGEVREGLARELPIRLPGRTPRGIGRCGQARPAPRGRRVDRGGLQPSGEATAG